MQRKRIAYLLNFGTKVVILVTVNCSQYIKLPNHFSGVKDGRCVDCAPHQVENGEVFQGSKAYFEIL